MKAIIYTSNTGSTAEYAQLLGKELNLPVHSLQKAKNKVPAGSEIIYLGWIMAMIGIVALSLSDSPRIISVAL